MKASMLLKRQHRDVEKLFATALRSNNETTRRTAMHDISSALEHHTQIEEKISSLTMT